MVMINLENSNLDLIDTFDMYFFVIIFRTFHTVIRSHNYNYFMVLKLQSYLRRLYLPFLMLNQDPLKRIPIFQTDTYQEVLKYFQNFCLYKQMFLFCYYDLCHLRIHLVLH